MADRTITGDYVANPVTTWAGTEIIPVVKAGANAAGTLDSVQAYLATMKQALNEAPPVSVASAATLPVAGAASNTINVTGTTTITALDAAPAGATRRLVFGGALTLTHHASTLILPGAANITTAAGDVASFVSLGGGAWRCWQYMRASGAAVVASGGGLTHLAESLSTAAPNNTTNAAQLRVVGGATAAVGLVLSPKGSGATMRDMPDGTATGGDVRGLGAVDFQTYRNSAAQVAGGQSSALLAGEYNAASGRAAVAAAGANAVVSGDYAGTLGGQYATVTGHRAVQLGGSSCTIDGHYATGLAGLLLSTRGITGLAVFGATAVSLGARQGEMLSLGVETTGATATALSSDSSAAGGGNQLVLANNATAVYRIGIAARHSTTGDAKAWSTVAVVKRGATAASTAILGTPSVTVEGADSGAAAWTVAIGADTSAGALRITVTGEAGKTIQWAATAVGAYVRT